MAADDETTVLGIGLAVPVLPLPDVDDELAAIAFGMTAG